MGIKAELRKDGKLVVEIDTFEPRQSNGGKMVMTASSGGFQDTDVIVDNKPLRVNVSAGFRI